MTGIINDNQSVIPTVLVCDDERDIANAIGIFLKAEGYNVLIAHNGKDALQILENEEIHLVLLDIMMPIMDGVTTLSRIRETGNVPVIMLTAKSEDTDKVLGLNLGADDYVTKPYNPVELMARVRSQLRRYMMLGGNATVSTTDDIICGGICMNDRKKEVFRDGELMHLTRTEYDILKLLMENQGTVFTPADIYKKVWKDNTMGSESIVAVHVRHLREKLEINPSEPRYIKMIWGRGYYVDKKRERQGE